MKKGAQLLLPIVTIAHLFFVPSNIQAHPGNTAADGCHYCRTNCAKWGVEEDERHCHTASAPKVSPATQQPQATNTPLPVKTLAPKTPPPSQSTSPTPMPTNEPEVMSLTTALPSNTPAPTSEATSGDALAGIGILALLIGFPILIAKRILVKLRK